jgi:hypothetical protein
VKEILMVFI